MSTDNRPALKWLTLAAWIATVASCSVAGLHRGTPEDPTDPVVVGAFYGLLPVAVVASIGWRMAVKRRLQKTAGPKTARP